MPELKTKVTGQSLSAFLKSIEDEKRRRECRVIVDLMKKATGASPKMWGPSIVGFGDYRYTSGGRENDWFLVGFSPRKQNLTLYLMGGFNRYPDLMKSLGKYKTGGGCLYVKTIDDIDLSVLEKLVANSARDLPGIKRESTR